MEIRAGAAPAALCMQGREAYTQVVIAACIT